MDPLMLLLQQLGLTVGDVRQDSKFTAVLSKELEYVKARTYDIVYPQLKARQLIPVSSEVDTGAETIAYKQWDEFGIAQVLSNYADDLPLVDALAEEFTQKIVPLGLGYQYSIQDLRRSAMSGTRLDQRRAGACRRGVEWAIEEMAVAGDSNHGVTGFANNANITLVSPTTGTWSTATGAQMVADALKLEAAILVANKETFMPTTLALDITTMSYFNKARISTTGDTHVTAKEAFLKSAMSVTEVVSWNKLSNRDAAGTGPRAVMYTKSPDVLTLEIPQEFEQFPPQMRNLSFLVPAHARCAGVIWYYPIGASYMDGL